MLDKRRLGRYALGLLVLVLFPTALLGGTLQIRTFNNNDRQSPQEWAHAFYPYYREYDAEPRCFVECPNGDLFIAGMDYGPYYRFMRVHDDGTVAWVSPSSRFPPLDYLTVYDVVNLAADRYLVVSGRDYRNGSITLGRTLLLCIDGLGEEVWNQSYDFGGAHSPAVAMPMTDGGVLVFTSSYSNATGRDLCAFRVDSNGTQLWNTTYATPLTDDAIVDAAFASDGSIISIAYGFNSSSDSSVSIVRCFEPTGIQRWNQTYDSRFYSVACGAEGNFVMVGGGSDTEHCLALCLDHDGQPRWSFTAPMHLIWLCRPSVAACAEGYLIVGLTSGGGGGSSSWYGLVALSIDRSGISRWTWTLETYDGFLRELKAIAGKNGGFYIMTSSLLARLPDPPALTTSIALLAQNSYTLTILLALGLSFVTLMCAIFARRRSTRSSSLPYPPLLGGLAVQMELLFLWTQLVATSGPLRPYVNEWPCSTKPSTALLFLMFTPAGIANGILGVCAAVGLQIGLYVLDSRRCNGIPRGLAPKSAGYPATMFVALLVFLVFYTLAYYPLSVYACSGLWQALAFWLAMVPFLNGVILVGFLPNFLLSWRWPQRTRNRSAPKSAHDRHSLCRS